MTPSATIAAITPTAAVPKPGTPSRASARSGTALSPAESPRAPTVTICSTR